MKPHVVVVLVAVGCNSPLSSNRELADEGPDEQGPLHQRNFTLLICALASLVVLRLCEKLAAHAVARTSKRTILTGPHFALPH